MRNMVVLLCLMAAMLFLLWPQPEVDLGVLGSRLDLGMTTEEAVSHYREAAEQGDAEAQTMLGAIYFYGTKVPKDDAEAAIWYRKAAEQGNPMAQARLGAMYDKGQGVPQDHLEAYAWANIAASQGSARGKEEAAQLRDSIARNLTADDLSKAQRRAKEYVSKYSSSKLAE